MTEARHGDQLSLIAQSVAGLAAALAEVRSISATGTEIYTWAALRALAAAGAQLDQTPPTKATGAVADVATVLATAEDELNALPVPVRGHVAVRAACAYLRQARRVCAGS